MGKSYTRNKELKQPDEFISLTHRAWVVISDHASRVLLMLGVAVVIIAAAWTWSYFRELQEEKATAAFARALDIYYAPVMTEPTKGDPDDEVPRFATRAKKLEAAESELSKVHDAHAGKEVGRMSLLLRAGARFERGRFDDAIADYERFLKEEKDPGIRAAALEGLMYCYEARNLVDKAMETIKKLPTEGDRRYLALFHEARLLALKGQKKEAIERFKQVQQRGSSSLASRAGERLAALDVK